MRIAGSLFVILLVVAAVLIYQSLFIVNETQRAMVLQFGAPQRVEETPGLKFKTPFIQDVVFFDDRVLELDSPPQELIVLGKKRLVVDAFARYRISDPLQFFQTVSNLRTARLRFSDILNAQLRTVFASAELDDIVRDKRRQLTEAILKGVQAETANLGVEFIDVRIKRADLPEQISNDVFARMRAEREREAAQFRAEGAEMARAIRSQAEREAVTIRAEATRESEILRGEGDAERNAIFADAFGRDPEFFAFYRSMQAYEKGLQRDTRLVISPDSEFFRFFGDPTGRQLNSGSRIAAPPSTSAPNTAATGGASTTAQQTAE